MSYKYFIATNYESYRNHIKRLPVTPMQCRYINDHLQISGLNNVSITVIGHGNKQLEEAILRNYSHRGIKLEYI